MVIYALNVPNCPCQRLNRVPRSFLIYVGYRCPNFVNCLTYAMHKHMGPQARKLMTDVKAAPPCTSLASCDLPHPFPVSFWPMIWNLHPSGTQPLCPQNVPTFSCHPASTHKANFPSNNHGPLLWLLILPFKATLRNTVIAIMMS